jgi:MFS family permease
MNKVQQLVIFINYFSLGLLMPVLNLILLEWGADFKTLPLLIGLYALSVLLFELPSGICADLLGRKTAFLISGIAKLFSLTLLIAADGIALLIPCVILNGISRAFSSGSLDALLIEQAVDLRGDDCIPKVSSRLSMLEAGGFATGSILGGFVSYAGIYLLLGTGNVAENTLINRYTPNHDRASILSLSSFLFQLGVLSASLASSLLAAKVSIRGIWILSGNFCFVLLVILFITVYKRNKTIISAITSSYY